MVDLNDYLSLITREHKDKPKFASTVSAVAQPFVDQQNLYLQTLQGFDLDIATGWQLDVIGQWVGASRVIPNALPYVYFGYSEDDTADGYAEDNGSGTITGGAPYYEAYAPTGTFVLLPDEQYRFLIRAQIIKNHYDGTVYGAIAALDFLFNGSLNSIQDAGNMSIKIAISRKPSLLEKTMIKQLDLIPRPAGVRIIEYDYFFNGQVFGYADDVNALGYAEDNGSGTITGGGYYSEAF